MIVNNVIGLAKTAKAFGVPTILSTVLASRGGALITGLQAVYPEQVPIDRTFINAWEDEIFVEAVRATGKRKLVIAALWTEICLAILERTTRPSRAITNLDPHEMGASSGWRQVQRPASSHLRLCRRPVRT